MSAIFRIGNPDQRGRRAAPSDRFMYVASSDVGSTQDKCKTRCAAQTTKRRPQFRRAKRHGRRRNRESVPACSILDLHPTYRMFLHEISFSQLSIGTGRLAQCNCPFFVASLCSSGSPGRRSASTGGSTQSGARSCSEGWRAAGRSASPTERRRRGLGVPGATVAGRPRSANGKARSQTAGGARARPEWQPAPGQSKPSR